jgi:hypothetical protein
LFLYRMYGLSPVHVNALKIQTVLAASRVSTIVYLTSTLARSATCFQIAISCLMKLAQQHSANFPARSTERSVALWRAPANACADFGEDMMLHKSGVTERLARFIAATRWDDIPAPVRHQAKRCAARSKCCGIPRSPPSRRRSKSPPPMATPTGCRSRRRVAVTSIR